MNEASHAPEPVKSEAAKPVKPKSCLTRCGQGNSLEAKRTATAILEVLAGLRTPRQAAQAVGLSVMRYYQVEARAVQGLVSACEPGRRGPERTLEKELRQMQRQQERLQRELGRQQAVARMAQRSIGLALPPKAEANGPAKGKKRQRRPVVRSLRMAAQLRPSTEAAPAPAPAAGEEAKSL